MLSNIWLLSLPSYFLESLYAVGFHLLSLFLNLKPTLNYLGDILFPVIFIENQATELTFIKFLYNQSESYK